MNWQKILSTILHPVVTPTYGLLLFFMISDFQLHKKVKLFVFSIVFIATYITPILLLILLRAFKLIKSYRVHSIEERKIPVFIMTILFILIGKVFQNIPLIRDFSILFYGTAFSLVVVYFLFRFKLKSSLHLLSMGSAVGFFLLLNLEYNYNILVLISVLLLCSGILAKARLELKAHTPIEVYFGFFLGILGQFLIYYSL